MSGSESKSIKQSARRGADLDRLLEMRRKIKARTPEFNRFESWRYVRIDSPWRKPKGVDNHMRLSVKGWPHLVKVGYRVPKQARHLHPSGYRDVLVHNISELDKISPATEAARLAAGLGRKKRIELAKRARELGIRVLNGRNLLMGQSLRQEEHETETKTAKKKTRNETKS